MPSMRARAQVFFFFRLSMSTPRYASFFSTFLRADVCAYRIGPVCLRLFLQIPMAVKGAFDPGAVHFIRTHAHAFFFFSKVGATPRCTLFSNLSPYDDACAYRIGPRLCVFSFPSSCRCTKRTVMIEELFILYARTHMLFFSPQSRCHTQMHFIF